MTFPTDRIGVKGIGDDGLPIVIEGDNFNRIIDGYRKAYRGFVVDPNILYSI